jgi:hypothetical protein
LILEDAFLHVHLDFPFVIRLRQRGSIHLTARI